MHACTNDRPHSPGPLSALRSQRCSCECECEFWRAPKIRWRIFASKSERKSCESSIAKEFAIGRKHPSRDDVIFSGQNLAKNAKNDHITCRSWAFKTGTFGITWCDNFWPNTRLEVAEGFQIRRRMLAACPSLANTNGFANEIAKMFVVAAKARARKGDRAKHPENILKLLDSSEPIFGKGMRRSTFQWRKGVFSEKGAGNSVNEGLGKDFYRKGSSVKSFGPFTEPPDSENWRVAVLIPFPKISSYQWKCPETPSKCPKNTQKWMTFSTFPLCPLWVCPLHLSKEVWDKSR